MKHFFASGQAPVEKRGGDHKTAKFINKQKAIEKFISTFKCVEAHY